MAGTLLYGLGRTVGSNPYPWYHDQEGNIICPCIIGDDTPVPSEGRKTTRFRPTGESGSGPYFVSYKTSGRDYDGAWLEPGSNIVCCSTIDVVKYDVDGSKLSQIHFYSNGVEAYSCGIAGGAYSRYVVWDYIVRHGDDYFYSIHRASSELRADSWEEAESLMREQLTLWKHPPAYRKAYTNRYYQSYANGSSFEWKLGEFDAFFWYDLTSVLPRGYQIAATQSYIAAANSIPEATTNSIANALQLAGSVVDLLHGDISPKSIKDVWLRYRYEYTTTKADIQEYAELTKRLTVLANATTVRCSGKFAYQGVSCVTSFDVDQSQWMPEDALSWLKTYGFKFSAINAWDMVPYSFIVDWFLHISDILKAFQDQGNAMSLKVSDCWHVFQTEYDNQFTMFRVPKAIRWGFPYVSYKPASNKTIGKRITDALALFLC